MHDKKITSIDVNRASPHLLVTGGNDATVVVWDVRKLSASGTPAARHKAAALRTITHGLAVTSASFSPDGHRLLTVSNDSTLGVHYADDFGSDAAYTTRMVRHNNRTGRWLTAFRGEWHPKAPSWRARARCGAVLPIDERGRQRAGGPHLLHGQHGAAAPRRRLRRPHARAARDARRGPDERAGVSCWHRVLTAVATAAPAAGWGVAAAA